MPKRTYPRKAVEERRIPVTFPLSGERLKAFRQTYAASVGHNPTIEECKEKASDLALQAIDRYTGVQEEATNS